MKRVRRNNRRAFTLAELLVVIAIIAIVAAVGILQLAKAKKDLQVKANDGNAKLIYLAAQNQLLQMKEFGQWDALLASEVEDDELKTGYFGYTLANPGRESAVTEVDDGEDHSLMPSDYPAFLEKEGRPTLLFWSEVQDDMRVAEHVPNEDGTQSGVISRMLPLGTVEDYVRTEGKYIIEYDVRTASVYGVFYTESQEGQLDYTEENFTQLFYGIDGQGRPYEAIGPLQGVDEAIARRLRRDYTGSNQKESILGYFGGSMAYGLDYTPLEIPEIRIDNGEELILSIRDSNVTTTNGGAPTPSTTIQIIVRGKNLGGSVTYELMGNELSGYYLLSSESSFDRRDIVRTGGYSEDSQAYEYEIVLDSITPGENGENYHFAHNFCNTDNTPVEKLGVVAGDDIEVTVLVKPAITADRVALPVSRTVETNSLFSSAKLDVDNYWVTEASIAQLRHLENLSADISGAQFHNSAPSASNPDDPGWLKISFENSVSFDGNGSGVLPVVPKDYTGKYITDKNGDNFAYYAKGSFIPINFNNVNPKITGYNCNVYNIPITLKDGAYDDLAVGLIGMVNSGRLMISKLGIVSSETATAEQSAEVKTIYSGNAMAMGAFAGYVEGEVVLTNCWSTVRLRSTNAVNGACIGGLIGTVSSSGTDSNKPPVTIKGCYVSGATEAGKVTDVYGSFSSDVSKANIYVFPHEVDVNVGGLIGNCTAVNIENSYCSADIGLEVLKKATGGVYNIGGLAGKATIGIKVTDSYFAGWMNMPLALEPRDDVLNYGGFVGITRITHGASAMRVSGANSFWITEFLGITNIPESTVNGVSVNGDYGKLLSDVCNLEGDPNVSSRPYNMKLFDNRYAYPDVTGLKHHWGDWCVEEPDIGLYFFAGAGVEQIDAHDDPQNGYYLPEGLEFWEHYGDEGRDLHFSEVPEGVDCDLGDGTDNPEAGNTIIVTLADGFEGVEFRDSGDQLFEMGDDGHYHFVTTGKSAVIYVRATGIPIDLSVDADNVRKVFNYEDTVITPTIAQTYDQSIRVRMFLAYTLEDQPNTYLPNDMQLRTDENIIVKNEDIGHFWRYDPNDNYTFLLDTSLDPDSSLIDNPFANGSDNSYTIDKDNHYGTLHCRLLAYAYCDEDAAGDTRPPIFSDLVSVDFSVTLERAPVQFVHDITYGPYSNWTLGGGNSSLTYYTEYDSDRLYGVRVGTTTFVPTGTAEGKFLNAAGTYLGTLPVVHFGEYYNNAFDFIGWDLTRGNETKQIYGSAGTNMLWGYSTTEGFINDKVWRLTNLDDPVELKPSWGRRPMLIGIDPNGGYWETIESATQPGGGT